MKFLTVVLISILTTVTFAQASQIQFDCQSSQLTFINNFSASGALNVVDGKVESFTFSGESRLRGTNSSLESFDIEDMSGTVTSENSDNTNGKSYSFVKLNDPQGKDGYKVTLILNWPKKMESRLVTPEGYVYYSTCH